MKSDAITFDPAVALLNPQLAGLLFYGSEGGLKDYFMAALSRLGILTLLSEAAFLEAPTRHLTPDLFMAGNTQPLICIEDVSDKNSKTYEAILASAPQGKLILYGPSLKTTSKLVQFAVKQPYMQAVGCYPLEPRQMSTLLQKAGQKIHLTFTPEALKALVFLITPSTLINSLTKLSLYKSGAVDAKNPAIIALDDVVACLGETEDESIEMAYALSGRRPDKAAQLLSKAGEALEPMVLIRQVLRHFMMLLQVRCALDNKVSLSEAISQLSPPLFFKKAPLFQAHVQVWSLTQIYDALSLLEKAEMAVKQSSLTVEAIPYFLSQIACLPSAQSRG